MRSGRDMIFSATIALLLHCMAGLALGLLLEVGNSESAVPEFRMGITTVELNLVATLERPTELPQDEGDVAPVVVTDTIEVPDEDPFEAQATDLGVEEALPDATTDVMPRYPLGSRIRGEEGVVRLKMWIDASGRVTRVEVLSSSGFPALDRAGIKAVKRAAFKDAEGRSVSSSETTVTFNFKIVE